ncbi:MAG: hypothetical protein GTO18_00680 [Anaerolineales bacterium]|nr:hypothetical protein [Anaerolineales bacterium]
MLFRRYLLPVFIFAITLAACAPNSSTFQENLARWESADLADYRYVLRVGCFCPDEIINPVVVEIRGDAVASITYQETGEQPGENALQFFNAYDSVEELFAVIEDAMKQDPAEMSVEYDPNFGVPISISIDYDRMMADEELYLEISEFSELE